MQAIISIIFFCLFGIAFARAQDAKQALEYHFSSDGDRTTVEIKKSYDDADGKNTGSVSCTIVTAGNLKPFDAKGTCVKLNAEQDILVYNARMAVDSVRTVVAYSSSGEIKVIPNLAAAIMPQLKSIGLADIEPESLECTDIQNQEITVHAKLFTESKERQIILKVVLSQTLGAKVVKQQ